MYIMSKIKKIPKFKNDDEERKFWADDDSAEYLDWQKAQYVRFPDLKLSTKSISLRVPVSLLEKLKVAANKRDVPYQSYAKMLLVRGVQEPDNSKYSAR